MATSTPCHPERSEWFAKRSIHGAKDPVTLALGTNPSRSSHHAQQHNENSLIRSSLCTHYGVFRLRGMVRFANHPTPLSMTDVSSILISTVGVFVMSFPKMSISLTTKNFTARHVTSNLAFHRHSVKS